MYLSLTAWSMPSCTLEEAAGISRALGIGALDVGLFYRSALDKAEILSDPRAAAERLSLARREDSQLLPPVRRGARRAQSRAARCAEGRT
jgi:hypothetical protein